jgi:electron transfer flavoprotein alpha subunit
MSGPAEILVVSDWTQEEPTRLTCELLGLGQRLAEASGGRVSAAMLDGAGPAQALIARGASEVYCAEPAALAAVHIEDAVAALAELCADVRPAVVLIGHSAAGTDLAARLAFRLETAVATGCVAVSCSTDSFTFTRPCQGGIAREVVSLKTTPAIATVRVGCHDASAVDPGRAGVVTRVQAATGRAAARMRVVDRRNDVGEDGVRLEDARVVVAGGRGLDGPDGFRALERLAQQLGGAVGASRVPCDLGWCPRSWQIGLTGRTVTPELYIAVGISGAGHHMAGCGNAKTIVAINTDPEAAIFKEARYGIVGDCRQFVPALIDEIKRLHD